MTAEAKQEAYRLLTSGEPDKALSILSKLLNESPDDVTSLFMTGEVFAKSSRYGMAAPYYHRVVELAPELSEGWNNLGICHHQCVDIDAATDCFLKSLQLSGDDSDAYSNLLLMNLIKGDHENALRLLNHALFHATNAEQKRQALANSSLAYLALRKWKPGWQAFELMLDAMKQRKRRDFGVPDWDGKQKGVIAVYGEQGLGDEIMFASMIPDMMAAGHEPAIECDPRLQRLFGRSFKCPVFGTRREENPQWPSTLCVKAKTAIGSLAKYYRVQEPFPRGPYLKACPDKCRHMRKALDSLPGRKMGIAWTGGTLSTRQKDRSLTLEQLKPVLSVPGITWISLEYKGGDPGNGILHWPEITQSNDYDDTAALVAELDGVVSVTTTVALLCGALGVPCDVLVPEHPTWHWAAQGDMPWYDSLRLWRRDGVSWEPLVARVSEHLLSPVRKAAQ